MTESNGQVRFRRPFGEFRMTKSEAVLAGNSFQLMTKSLYESTDLRKETLHGDVFVRGLVLQVEKEGFKAHLRQQGDMKTGRVAFEKVKLYESGETDDEWGPQICGYVTGGTVLKVRRYDVDGEFRNLTAEMLLYDDTSIVHKSSNGDIAFEKQKVSTGGFVGVEEVNELRDCLSHASPLPYTTPKKTIIFFE